MADRKISELTNITGADIADGDEFVVVDASASETKAIVFSQLKEAISTGGLSFGDNDKAIFGAGSDLQIYSDGSSSFIAESGSGNLVLNAGGLRVNSPDNTETLLKADVNGAVQLRYDNAPKLDTTSTGIDVTGTVTADGLTVDKRAGASPTQDSIVTAANFYNNQANVTGDGVRLFFDHSFGTAGTQTRGAYIQTKATSTFSQTVDLDFYTTASSSLGKRLTLAGNGDISFYEDTGTTAKFFWDASAERLGIGTSSPSTTLQVEHDSGGSNSWTNAGSTAMFTETNAANPASIKFNPTTNSNGAQIVWGGAAGDGPFVFRNYNAERMRIDSSGNVGIGVVPETVTSTYKVLELGYSTAILARTAANQSYFANNIYHDSGWKYKTTDPAALYQQVDDQHVFFNAASGTADTTVSFSERMRIDSSGNVGIGDSTPSQKLDVNGNVRVTGGYIEFSGDTSTPSAAAAIHRPADNTLAFSTLNSEAMRIDSSGNLLVGTTTQQPASTSGVEGFSVYAGGQVQASKSGATVARFNRNSSDGDIVQFRKDGSTVGSIGNGSSTSIYIAGNTQALANLGFGGSSLIYPTVDNVADLGAAGLRFDDIYATNGTIQTSDQNEKQDIAELSDAEQRVAVAAKGLLRKFRWRDAVAEKGDEARTHFGIIAQDLQAAFAAEGLDAGDYAMFIHTTWTDEETGEERTRMGVRYSELLAFIIAAI